jgi:hypothetical protein
MVAVLIVVMSMALSYAICAAVSRFAKDDLEESFLLIKNALHDMQRVRTTKELMEDKNYEELQRIAAKMQIELVRRRKPELTRKRRESA